MTTFRALPVAQGDAFLLTTSDTRAYLVDGGRRRAGVPSMPSQLRASGVPVLDAAIVTHTDRDHVEGIEDLLSEMFPVAEYWVPVNWLDTVRNARWLSGNWRAWIETVGKILSRDESVAIDGGDLPRGRSGDAERRRDDEGERALMKDLVVGGIATSALALATTSLEESTSSESFNARRERLLSHTTEIVSQAEETEDYLRPVNLSRFYDGIPYPDGNAAAVLSRAAASAVEGIRSDAAELTRTLATIGRGAFALATARRWFWPDPGRPRIRFFDYRGAIVDHAVPGHPMNCVNGSEVTEPIEMPRAMTYDLVAMVTRVASLSRVNRESRVFRFDDGRSEVLFCGDSALAFADRPIALGQPAIVTAPHHGALANAKAYSRVAGARLTWVRSDEQNSNKRPCGNYVALPRKYCTTCGGPPACVELVFDRVVADWRTDAPPCRCTPRAPTYSLPSWHARPPVSR